MPTAVLLNPDDPAFDFFHMMAHRQYFAVMRPLSQFSALPYNLDPSFDVGKAAESWNQNHQQAHNDFNGSLPNNSVSGVKTTTVPSNRVDAVAATTSGSTQVVLTVVTGKFILGSFIFASSIDIGTTITAQVSGTPGLDGTYTMSLPATATATGVAAAISHAAFEQATALPGNHFGMSAINVLIEGTGEEEDQRALWAFWNHTEHMIADSAILPLPTQAPTSAGSGPGTVTGVSDPWWWAEIGGDIIYPFW
jgi:hypothetical protein